MAKLFGNHIDPACSYCALGHPAREGNMILCPKNGVVAPHYSCRKFQYDPLKRIPIKTRRLPRYNPDDFKL